MFGIESAMLLKGQEVQPRAWDQASWSTGSAWSPGNVCHRHGNGSAWPLSGSYQVDYDGFCVPADAVAVFEVSLRMHYSGESGSCEVNFHDPTESALVCPYVALTAPLLMSG